MQVVLLERIERLGKMGDVVTVKPGYARNFLLPQNKALRATKANIEVFEKQRADLEAQSKDLQTKAEGMKKKMDGHVMIIARQSSEAGVLFGSVTTREIAGILSEKFEGVTRHKIILDAPIKAVGIHEVPVQLHPEVRTTVKISIAPSEEEAQAQLVKKQEPKKEEKKETSEVKAEKAAKAAKAKAEAEAVADDAAEEKADA
jgi:large subunit ribosomal protein L9